MVNSLAIIPARYASTRFPGKPLSLIAGKPMLRHVYDNVVDAGLFKKVIIATDDKRIESQARSWGAEVMMTSSDHSSGTDRCAEVAMRLESDPNSIIVNIQGDEPFIAKQAIATLLHIFENKHAQIATLYQSFSTSEDLTDQNMVKVVLANDGKALYFSRAIIPFSKVANCGINYYKHIGMYAFKASILKEIATLSQSSLEMAEGLEQLRWLENGYSIYAGETGYTMCSVDTPEDIARAEEFIKSKQKENIEF